MLLWSESEVVLNRHFILPTTDEFFFRIAYEGELVIVPYGPFRIGHGRSVDQCAGLTIRREVIIDGTRSDLIVSEPNGLVAVAVRHEKALLFKKLQDVLIPIKVSEFIRYFAKVQFHGYANVVLKYMNLPEAATGSLKLNYFYPPSKKKLHVCYRNSF
jgi:hypothetical protein